MSTASGEELAHFMCTEGSDGACKSNPDYGVDSCCYYTKIIEVPANLTVN